MRINRQHVKAIKIQAWYRGCAGRKVAEIVSQSRTQLQVEEDFLDSTVQIQRLLRGHFTNCAEKVPHKSYVSPNTNTD